MQITASAARKRTEQNLKDDYGQDLTFILNEIERAIQAKKFHTVINIKYRGCSNHVIAEIKRLGYKVSYVQNIHTHDEGIRISW